MRVASMRSAVYIGEQECPYDEEFDGNDMSATHLLGYVGQRTGAAASVSAISPISPKSSVWRCARNSAPRACRFSWSAPRIELCRMKGYRRLYGHAQKRLVNFWSRFGFRLFEGGRELVFSDFDYVEMVADIRAASRRHPHRRGSLQGDPARRPLASPGRSWRCPHRAMSPTFSSSNSAVASVINFLDFKNQADNSDLWCWWAFINPIFPTPEPEYFETRWPNCEAALASAQVRQHPGRACALH